MTSGVGSVGGGGGDAEEELTTASPSLQPLFSRGLLVGRSMSRLKQSKASGVDRQLPKRSHLRCLGMKYQQRALNHLVFPPLYPLSRLSSSPPSLLAYCDALWGGWGGMTVLSKISSYLTFYFRSVNKGPGKQLNLSKQ